MTKRLIIAVAFLLCALFMSLYSNSYVLATVNELYELCDNVEPAKGKEQLSDVFAFWNLRRRGIFVFLKHADVDVLNRYLALLADYSEKEKLIEAENVLFELKSFLDSILTGESVKFENIF